MVSRGAALDDRPAFVPSGKRRLDGLRQSVRLHLEHLWKSGRLDSRTASWTLVQSAHGDRSKAAGRGV